MERSDKVIPVRLPADYVEKIDRFVAVAEEKSDSRPSSRSGWMRHVIIKAVRERERELARRAA